MKKLLHFTFLLALVSCGQPSSDRPDFEKGPRDPDVVGDNSRLATTCSVNSKEESFKISVNQNNPITVKKLESSFSDTKLLIEEYEFDLRKESFSMKAYLALKEDKTAISNNAETINFDFNDKKIIRYRYVDEKAFDVSIDCSTNQPIEIEAKLQ